MAHRPRLFLLAFSIAALSIPMAAFAPGHAADTDVAGPVQTHDPALQSRAGKFVQELGDRVIRITADKQMSTERRNVEFNKILTEDFDLRTIGRFVIGRTW